MYPISIIIIIVKYIHFNGYLHNLQQNTIINVIKYNNSYNIFNKFNDYIFKKSICTHVN